MSRTYWAVLGFLGLVQSITINDFYPYSPQDDMRLPNGDSVSSRKISLRIPVKFYDTEYDYMWINTDGFISFEPDTSDVAASDFPFKEALLSPFMSDLDTTTHGDIYYRESNELEVLARATADVHLAFPITAFGFEAETAFIVTWHEVEGRSINQETALFTFQCIIVSNGRDSYAIYLYPRRKMAVFPAGVTRKSTSYQARTGFNQGPDQYLEMYPVESLINHRNTHRKGEWIFQIGGERVKRDHEIVAPEKVRHVKRQTSFVSVQDVSLTDEEDAVTEDEEEETPVTATSAPASRSHDFCSRGSSACLAEHSECVNHRRGYCCRCLAGYLGNGRVCIADDATVRVSGNATGTVDVRAANGDIERVVIRNVDTYVYTKADEGRSYTAISGVTPTLGRALQPISLFGEVIGWMFAIPTAPAVNGFQFTGGSLQRRVSIKYQTGDYSFDMRQRFQGARKAEEFSEVLQTVSFVGRLPAIAEDASVKMENYEIDYVKTEPGRIRTSGNRVYTVDDEEFRYRITEDIIFSECRDAFSSVPDTMKLHVSQLFIKYQNDDNVRYAMNTKITAPGASDVPSHPCQVGNHNCHSDANCEPLEGQDYSCHCRTGFAGNGNVCEDIDECVGEPCQDNAVCFNERGSFSCQCFDGYVRNAAGECEALQPSVTCDDGFTSEDGECVDIDECAEGRYRCGEHSGCVNSVGSYQCVCDPGFEWNGNICRAQCPGNQVFSTCAGCFITCDQRNTPVRCTLQCRVQCTCPSNTYLNGDMCVTADECPTAPTARPKSQCEIEYEEVEDILRENPTIQDGPDLPDCRPDGTFAPKQCNNFTRACWCVDPELGTVISDTMTARSKGDALVCEGTPCRSRYMEIQAFHRNNPDVQDGPIYPRCEQDGSYSRKQCNGFTGHCWCVDKTTGDIHPNSTTTSFGESRALVCPEPTTGPSGVCRSDWERVRNFHRRNPDIADGPDYPECSEDGTYKQKQCNDFTRVCWCVDPENGRKVAGTMGNTASCDEDQQRAGDSTMTHCQIAYEEASEFQRRNPQIADGPDYPECEPDGPYRPRQCNDFTGICWCVNTENGTMIPGTLENTASCGGGQRLTPCQQQQQDAQEAQRQAGPSAGPIFQPICTTAGAYEPVQFHPSGYFTCVDINGVEVSRHQTQPKCLTPCQSEAYYAKTDNTLSGSSIFVPQCTEDGGYSAVQCDESTRTCYCADRDGIEIRGSRRSTEGRERVTAEFLECARLDPTRREERAAQVVYAQSTGINGVDLPITSSSTPQRLFSRVGQIAVGVAFDCSRQNVYWTDVSGRAIYMSPISDASSRTSVINTGLKSPEGVAIDFISGNMYWTDSGTDKIEVAKTDGTNRKVLISSGLKNARGIAVDPFGGKLYWVDWDRKNPRIMWSNLDGSDIAVFLKERVSVPNDITIDPFHRRLCYIDAGTKKVICMNLDGSQRSVVYDITRSPTVVVQKPFGLAVDGGKVYYTDRFGDRLHAVNTATGEDVALGGPTGAHGHMYGVTVAHSRCSFGYNACSLRNGGCSHLCLPIPNGKVCKCPDGDNSCTEE